MHDDENAWASPQWQEGDPANAMTPTYRVIVFQGGAQLQVLRGERGIPFSHWHVARHPSHPSWLIAQEEVGLLARRIKALTVREDDHAR